MNILITGGTGFLGKELTNYFVNQDHNIIILTRNKKKCLSKTSNNLNSKIKFIDNLSTIQNNAKIDVIINLAGATISQRWSNSYKQILIKSRTETTENLLTLISRLSIKPELLISASAIGYYGSQKDNIIDENSDYNNEFTHRLCSTWENIALKAKNLGVRTCIVRLGVILGKNGGALKKMLLPFKLCLGGKIGSGQQYFSWVHMEDAVRAINFLINNKKSEGIYNLTSPNPITNYELTKALGSKLKRPTIIPMPSFMIKILFGEMGEVLLLNGQRVVPYKLKKEGFNFSYDKIDVALKQIL